MTYVEIPIRRNRQTEILKGNAKIKRVMEDDRSKPENSSNSNDLHMTTTSLESDVVRNSATETNDGT